MDTHRKKIGLALGSGGVRGLAHIGVLKVLLRNNIPIDYIAGASIGAWIGAFYSMNKDLSFVEERALEYRRDKLIALLEPSLKGGVVKGKKVSQLLHEWLQDITFDKLHIPVAVVTTDLIAGEEYIITSGSVAEAVRASIAIPLVFQPIEYEDKLLVDGGLLNPLPVDRAYEMGADHVIAVNVDMVQKLKLNKKDELSLRGTGLRSFHLMRQKIVESSKEQSDVLINIDVPLQPMAAWKKYFTKESLDDIVQMGERAAEEQLPKIKALLADSQ